LRLAYLFIAHDLAVVRQLSDRIAVMYLGKLVEVAERDALFAVPRHPYTRALFSAIPIPDPERERARQRIVLGGEVPSPASPPAGCAFHPRCPERAKVAGDRCRLEVPELAGGVACHLHG
jgi:oligopeptide/dipeptide ABC transporter ATP-binding protein